MIVCCSNFVSFLNAKVYYCIKTLILIALRAKVKFFSKRHNYQSWDCLICCILLVFNLLE